MMKNEPRGLKILALALLVGALVTMFHYGSGSRGSELGSHPDEAAHFITGLMVRDYLASGFHESPLRYADEYYRHYPKIGLGVWPPVFYVAQAVWTLVIPAGAAGPVNSVLWLMAALGLGLGVMTGWWLWREYGWIEAVTGATLLTALPLVQQYSNMVMAEMLSALLMFAAAGFFARYLEGAEWRGAVGFGVCAGLAVMTKGTGLALAGVPVVAIVLTGRYELLRRASLWVAALLVAGIAGPWTWHFRNQGRGGWEEPSPSVHFTKAAIGFYGREMCVALGGVLAVLAVAGAVFVLWRGRRKPEMAIGTRPPTDPGLPLPPPRRLAIPAIVVCSLALVAAVWIFQCVTPVGLEARHLMPAMPALIVLAMAGLNAMITQGRGRERQGLRLAAAAGVLAVFFGWPAVWRPAGPAPGYGSLGNGVAVSPFRVPRKEWGGFGGAADRAYRPSHETDRTDGTERILVASDARGEGMFIAEVAARDTHRPSHTVERASKVMASSTWSGGTYEQFYHTPGEVLAALAHEGITMVVLDSSSAAVPAHQKLLAEALDAPGSGFSVTQSATAVRDGRETPGAIRVYSR